MTLATVMSSRTRHLRSRLWESNAVRGERKKRRVSTRGPVENY